jgi:PAS domain S-box-containing protein
VDLSPLQNKLEILEYIPDIVAIVDTNKIYTWINKSGLEFFGQDAIGKSASYYFEGKQDTYDKVNPLFSGSSESVYLESWQKRKDGQKRLLAWWCNSLKDNSGKIMGTISTARDITDQKIVEDRLQRAQALAHVGNWELDLTTHKIWASKESFDIYGVNQKSPELDLEIVQNMVIKSYRPILDNALDDLIKYGTKYNQEFQIIRESDKEVRTIHSIAELQKDSSGKPCKVLGVIQDITTQKKVDESLKHSQLVLQNIIDLLPVRIFWKDVSSNFLGCNMAFAKDAGYSSPQDLIGKNDFQLSWKDQANSYREDDLKVIRSGESKINYEEPQTTPTGKTIWLNTNKVPLLDNSGTIIGVLGTYLDITDQKQAFEELKRKNKDLEIINSTMVDRELKMIELKKQVQDLESRLDKVLK